MSQQPVLIVTGGSRGIGAAISQLAAQRGYAVAINYAAKASAAEHLRDQINAAGGRAIAVQGDVSQESEVLRLFATTEHQLGPITALVNNAGISGGLVRLESMTAQSMQDVFAVNVIGTMLCAREAVRRMSTKHGGTGGAIVNVSSLASRIGGGGEWVHYAASKAAVNTFTQGLAREVATEGIRVNAVSPGVVITDFHEAAGDASRITRFPAMIPMQRLGQPEEIAEAVLWLLSPAASYATGSILEVGGGR